MSRILVTYYSRSGNTAKMAEEVVAGLREVDGVDVELRPVAEVAPEDLLKFDGIAMGSPVRT